MNVNSYNKYNRSIKGRFRGLKRAAKKQGHTLTISIKEYTQYIKSNICTYCGGSIGEVGHGLDRINSKKGYIKGNITPCCNNCNRAKSNQTLKAFKLHILKIYGHWAKKT